MSYRRGGRDEKERQRAWSSWLQENADLIAKAGLPEFVVRDEDHWLDFLMHGGHVEHHPTSWSFTPFDLKPKQQAALLRLLLELAREKPSCEHSLIPSLIMQLLDTVEKSHLKRHPIPSSTKRSRSRERCEETYFRGEWGPWVRSVAHWVDRCGLPIDIFADEEEWARFVGWKRAQRIDFTGFSLDSLSKPETWTVLRLLVLWQPTAYLTPLAAELLPVLLESVEALPSG